jgi:hypothetical protein
VSDKLWQATNQRGKLGNLTAVDNVKQADIIVSPTGRIGRCGYATPGGFEDHQGHLVISVEDLTNGPEINAQLTVLHELWHTSCGTTCSPCPTSIAMENRSGSVRCRTLRGRAA